MNRNDAPVSIEPPVDHSTISSQLRQKTDDVQTSSLCRNLQAKTDQTAQDTLYKFRKSSESCSVILTHQKQFHCDSPAGTENIPERNISPATQENQVDAAIKAVERTKVQNDEKAEVNGTSKLASCEKILEMETEALGLHKTEGIKTLKTSDLENKVPSEVTGDTCNLGRETKEPTSTLVEKTSSDTQKLKSGVFDTDLSEQTQTLENITSLKPIKDSKQHPKAEPKVISIAEIMRSQIKALESVQANSGSSTPAQANLAQGLTVTAGASQEGGENIKHNRESNVFKPDNKTEESPKCLPLTNLKATLVKIDQPLDEKKEQAATSTPAQPLNELPVSFRSTDTPRTELHGRNDDEAENDSSLGSDSRSKGLKDTLLSLTSKDKITETLQSVLKQSKTMSQKFESPVRETHIKASFQETNVTILEHIKDQTVQNPNTGFIQTQVPAKCLDSKVETRLEEVDIPLPSQLKMDNANTASSLGLQTDRTESKPSPAKQENDSQVVQQESSEVKDHLRSEFLNNLSPEPSPLVRSKNCISPVPSASLKELASGARRKLSTPSTKPEEAHVATSSTDNQTQTKGSSVKGTKMSTSTASPSPSRRPLLLQPAGEQSSVTERLSPLLSRRKTVSEAQTPNQALTEQTQTEGKPAEDRHNPFKAPQVIRKIRTHIIVP
ncbi:uncharacterized protein LOC119425706 [Nematolebias whitei]|uniref:uncharacterized protein LOC119425706 n=1 Tax=Nematolebias whitei TaxID=451745 RepID=UPI0018981C5C|nr:uncharacterized protein LOC119425706 [Nematolebias whitei]